jgi:hypothetical protein
MNRMLVPCRPGQTPFTKRQAELFFPPEFGDDFPVSMHISEKYGVIYVVGLKSRRAVQGLQ